MKYTLLIMLLLMVLIGCATGPKISKTKNLFPLNYIWLRVDSLEVKGSGQVRKIIGSTLSNANEILSVDSLAKSILCIQRKPDGLWQLPPNIYYKKEEIVPGLVYKVIYEFSDTAPMGKLVVTAYGR